MHWRADPAAAEGPWLRRDWCDVHEGRLLAADSWRVVDGGVRGLDAHRARFLARVARFRDDGERFFDEVVAALPRRGDWFPRVELRDRGAQGAEPADRAPAAAGLARTALTGTALTLRLRPTPPTATEVAVATAPHDPRTEPLVKGPDLEALQRLRTAVQPLGAGEAIILSPGGLVVEGAYSALVWWRPDGALVQPGGALARIPSVTARILVEGARRAGVAIEQQDAPPGVLAGCELWVLSALHGLRVATAWVAGPPLVIEPGRADRGRAWLDAALRPLP